MSKSVTRSSLSRKIAKDISLTIKQVREIAEATEEAILDFLLEREQVRIHEFGTFYQTKIKSHVIKQIRTKTPRIVLEQKTLKFRPSPIFKNAVYGKAPKPKRQEGSKIKNLEGLKSKKGNISVQYTPTVKEPPKPKTKISFGPISIHPRVDRENIQKKIKERWIKVAKTKTDEYPQYQIVREAEIFGRLLARMKSSGLKTIDFTFDKSPDIKIFAGRPRTQVSHLPREVVKGFLTYIDLEDFHIPQHRYKLLFHDQTKYDKIYVVVHSFPLDAGASIHIELK